MNKISFGQRVLIMTPLVWLYLAAFGCLPPKCPDSPTVIPVEGGILDAQDNQEDDDPIEGVARYPVCLQACANLKRLGCPEARQLPQGKTCYRVCADGFQNGRPLRPTCVAAARDVEDVRLCRTVRCLNPENE